MMRLLPALLFLPFGISESSAAQQSSAKTMRGPALVISASSTKIELGDEVTFTARIRPDLSAEILGTKTEKEYGLGGRIIGWHWIPDLDNIDDFTKACPSKDLTCTMFVGWSGTMVFSIQVHNQLCADWVHIDATLVPQWGEKDSIPRVRFDSVHKAMKTKSPNWTRCSV